MKTKLNIWLYILPLFSNYLLLGKEEGTELYISLKREWDYSPHIEKNEVEKYCHIPRDERLLLIDFVRRKNEGALLISGKRGVGKSSLVFSAIHAAVDELISKDKLNALPILVNAPNFEIRRVNEKGEKISEIDLLEFKRIVLQNLVRRLYQLTRSIRLEDGKIVYDERLLSDTTFTESSQKMKFHIQLRKKVTQNSPISIAAHTKISELFTRAIAKEVREETNLGELEREQSRLETKSRIELSMAEKLVVVASSLVSAGVIAIVNPFADQIINTIVALLAAVIPSSAIAISWERTKNRITEYEQQKKASIYYYHDYDLSTLQSELEDKLQKLSELNCKVIVVIDELDKMEYKDVVNVIKSLKTLFNQASALFILVSGEEFFTELVKNSIQRPTEYTLFPQKIFLQRPQFDDVRKFIDGILEKPNFKELERNKEYQDYNDAYYKFRNYVCYASKTDYFDLYNILRDYISFDQNGPRLNIRIDKKLETSANLQRALEAIYLRKKLDNQSDWYKNDILLNTMYDLLSKLAERQADTKFLKIEREPQFRIVFLNKNSEEIKNKGDKEKKVANDMEKEAITDMIYYLVRLKFLNLSTEVDKYEITGVLEDVPSEIKPFTKEENDFMNQYKVLLFLLIIYANLYSKYGGKKQ